MKLLYIFQQPRSTTSGLSIYDKRLSIALEELGHDVHRIPLGEASSRSGYWQILRGLPPAIARFQTRSNARAVALAFDRIAPDKVVLSHESMLYLIDQGVIPRSSAIILCHNMMAEGYRKRRTLPDRIYSILFEKYERLLATAQIPITAISQYDRKIARRAYGLEMAADCPPGVLPDTLPVERDAEFSRSIYVAGNYDWRLKRQDIRAFFDEARATALDHLCTLHLSEGAARHAPGELKFERTTPYGGQIGIGLIVDRFEAGFKLKALEYVSSGMAIASYCDVSAEFAEAPDADRFVRRISTADDLRLFLAELEELSDLGPRYRRFQQHIIERYQWKESARAIERLL